MGNPGVFAQQRLGRYELLARLATGGMGEIFLARLEGAAGFEKLYVVKRILPHLADDARFRQMLIAEAQIASKISHPNICQVYELGETAGQLYIVMEYLEGVTLLPLLRKASKEAAPLDFGFVGGVIQQSCDALNYAHELKDRGGEILGIVHRDVTPSNVFLTESGVAKVLDFGIAKAKGASANTQTGAVKGKYAYMAPEQLRGAGIDRRVDVFALGVVVYEMLALRRLFQRNTDYLTFRAVMEQPIPDVRRYRADVPESVAAVLVRALEREPDARYDTARQFGTALLDALTPVKRPWTQGEIGDFVRANFAGELGKRSHQVATAVNRTSSGGVVDTRATMPLIAHQDTGTSESEDDDDDDGFPSVDTVTDAGDAFTPAPPRAATPTDFAVGGTPPPFGLDTTGSAPSLQPLRGNTAPPGPTTAPVVVVGQRSLVWPLFAVAMVAVACGALFLVWKQMQQQQQQQPLVITSGPAGPGDPPVGSAASPPPNPGSAGSAVPPDTDDHPNAHPPGVGSGSARPRNPPPTTGPRPKTYDEAIAAKKSDMVQCLRDHQGDGLPSEAIVAKIKIGASGRAKTVALQPDALNAAPLGACLRNVLIGAAFPSAGSDVDISVPLKPKST